MTGAKCIPGIQPDNLAKTPAHTVALDGISDLLGNGKAYSYRAGLSPITRLQDKCSGRDLHPARRG